MRAVYVEWEDACNRDLGPWVESQEWQYEPRIVKQLGFVLLDTVDCLIITEAYQDLDNGATSSVNQIPRKNVLVLKELNGYL